MEQLQVADIRIQKNSLYFILVPRRSRKLKLNEKNRDFESMI